jgi:hypothetical protein
MNWEKPPPTALSAGVIITVLSIMFLASKIMKKIKKCLGGYCDLPA